MSKYYSKKTEIDGIKFDSKKEATYYVQLLILQRGKFVKSFDRQVAFELQPKFKAWDGSTVRAIKYIADFVVVYSDGHTEVVDVKGYRTKEYQLKRKMFLYTHPGVQFVEV